MMEHIRLAHPWAMLTLLLLPLLWWLWLRPRRRPVIRFSGLRALRSAGGAARVRMRLALPILRTLALLSLIVAVARPQRADESTRVFSEGIAIQLVVDRSGSMEDLDLSTRDRPRTRLDVVKHVVSRFVLGDEESDLPGRPDDLIGLVCFARYADSLCPLTLDHENLIGVLDQIGLVGQDENLTAVGDGLALAVTRLKDLKRTTGSGDQIKITSRIVILLTDGENNHGMVTPEQAGELAATYGIKVYTILAGTGQRVAFGARMPVDDRELRHIAEVTGGRHFRARDRESLAKIYAEIDKLERTKVEERRFVRWGELAHWWLVAAFACLGIQMFLDSTVLRKIP